MSNITTVTNIGRGVRLTEEAVPQIVATLPEGFDADKRGAVAEAVHAWACGTDKRPAQTKGPAGAQVTTDYGTGVNTLVKAVKRALSADAEKPVVLRASLSGEGGGSVTIEPDHALYAALVTLIQGQSDESAA